MKDSDPEYPGVVIGNYVFGGGSLSSRLGDRVRQKDGLSYGVGSAVSSDAINARSSLTIFAMCNPKVIRKVNAAISEELIRLLDDGITPAELEKAARLFAAAASRAHERRHARFASGRRLVADRTMEYYAELETKIAGLTPKAVLAALKKAIDPRRLVVVNAGDFGEKAAAK